jgi:hypothetical protein
MFRIKPRLGDAHKVKTNAIKDGAEFINTLDWTGIIEVTDKNEGKYHHNGNTKT